MCAGAWHHVRVRGRQRLLAPMLVTGCKVWHLREAGVFYPKHAWLHTIAALPDGAQVARKLAELTSLHSLTVRTC